MSEFDVLIVPGWKNSGPAHWQTLWQNTHPEYRRVEQKNWNHPVRSHWIEQLELHVQAARKPVILVAHSLGCITVAHWARPTETRVAGALLVAPADVERRKVASELRNFAPVPRKSLPFPSIVVGSTTDLTCSTERAQEFSRSWGSEFVNLGDVGHINVDSGHGLFPQGEALLHSLTRLGLLLRGSAGAPLEGTGNFRNLTELDAYSMPHR